MALDYALGIKHIVWGLSFEEFPFAIAASGDCAGFRPSPTAASPLAFCAISSAFDWVAASFKVLLEAPRHVRASMKRNGVAEFDGDPVEGPAIAARFEAELAGTGREPHGTLPQAALEEAQSALAVRHP